MIDAQTRSLINQVAREIAAIGARTAALERGQRQAQLGRSTVDDGVITFKGRDGVIMRVGKQVDGAFAVVTGNGLAPPAPAAPVITPGPLELAVAWDGTFEAAAAAPSDLGHLEVHVSLELVQATASDATDGTYVVVPDAQAAGFPVNTPLRLFHADGSAVDELTHTITNAVSAFGFTNLFLDPVAPALVAGDVAELSNLTRDTLRATLLPKAGTVVVSPLTTDQHYVNLVAVSTSGTLSASSAAIAATPENVVPPGTITETEIADDSISTPKLQANSVAAGKVAANAILAGNIAAGAVTAETLEAVLVLVNRMVAGDPLAARLELNSQGILAFDVNGNPTLQISGSDGSIAMVGSIQTDADAMGWSMGDQGLWVTPGTETGDLYAGNPGKQIAWQNQGDLYAFLEARTDNSLWLQNNKGDLYLASASNGSVVIRAADPDGGNLTVAGKIAGRTPVRAMAVDLNAIVLVPSGGTFAATHIGEGATPGWSTVVADSGDITLSGAEYFVIPTTGVYRVEAGCNWEANGTVGYRYFDVMNQTTGSLVLADRRGNFNATAEMSASRTVRCSAGDQLYMRVHQTTGASIGLRHGATSGQQIPPAWMSVTYVGETGKPSTGEQRVLVVEPIETASYQYGPANLWRDGDQVYMGDGGSSSDPHGNHRGFFFYGAGAFDALAGMAIDQVIMYVRRTTDEGTDNSIRPYLRGHPFTTNPAPAVPSFSGTYPDYGLIGEGWKKGQFANVVLPNQVGIDLAAGATNAQGLMFEDTGGGRYGRFSKWSAHSTTADGTLTITYHNPAAVVPPAPTSVQVINVTGTTADLSWDDVLGATSYNVYRGGVLIASPTTSSYTVTGLTVNTTYSFTVSAVNTTGESPQSATVSATTAAT